MWDCPEEGSSNFGVGAQSIIASLWVRVNCEGNAIHVPTNIVGSAKLPNLIIREAVRPGKIIRRAYRKCNRKWRSHADGQLPHSLYPLHENREIERRVRYQKISGKVGNLEKNEGWHE